MDIIGTEVSDLYVSARNWVVKTALGRL
jgi:hypothetical protein